MSTMSTHKFRENISDKSLRQFFNQQNGTPNKRYKATDYTKLRQQYHKILDQHREQQRVNKNIAQKAKRDHQKNTKNIKMEEIKSKITKIDKPDIAKLKDALKKYAGKSVIVEYLANKKTIKDDTLASLGNKKIIRTKDYQIDSSFKKFWNENGYDWFFEYDEDIFTHYDNKGSIFIYPQNENINTGKVVQLFREGITNCLLTPIRKWANVKLEGNTNKCKVTKCRYNNILKSLDEYEKAYINGVPEDAINEICNKLQIDITIEMPFCENKFIEGQSIKKRLKKFPFMNTRLNHIDLNEVVSLDECQIVTRDELEEIKEHLDDHQIFYTFKKDKNNIVSISTLTHNYKLNNEFSEVVVNFEIATGLNFCKIDDVDDHELSKFIKEGTNYNSTVDFKHYSVFPLKSIKHIDMKKAYANFKSCTFYKGFLGKITDFRQTDTMCGVGMYRITKIKIPEGKFKRYNDKLKIYLDNNIYTSVELELLTHYGATYKIVSGCWGVSPIDFEFNEDMMEKRDHDDIPFYSKWAGLCDQHKLEKKFWIKGEEDYFRAIKNNCGDKTVRWFENGEGCIAYSKKHNYHLGHITAFITAYQRMNTIEQLMEIEYDNLVRVCVDGIYHVQEEVALKNVFRSKEDKKFGNDAGDTYVSSACERDLIVYEPKARPHYSKELHIGQGGCGKTHINLNDKGLVKVLYLAPSWKLARCKKNETGINCSVWARALSDDPQKLTAIKEYANVLLVDEISMLSEASKQKIFSTFKDMKIIMCGDLGFQLPCIDGVEANTDGFDNIVTHNTDHRCKDEKLRRIKMELRKMISEKKTKAVINEWVVHEFEKLGKLITIDELKDQYSINDMILSGTNELKDFYSKMFEGTFDQEKYYVLENNRMYCNGDIVVGEKPDKCKYEVRHAFTTHSIQGETAKSLLFIDSCKMFDSRMFYTAISRAKMLDQIFIIQNHEHAFQYEYGKIYKIESKKGVYIGSTIKPLNVRLNKHMKGKEKYDKVGGKYITSYGIMGDDAVISKIEDFKCNDLKELWKREAEIIKQFGTKCVNKTFNEWKQ